MSTSPPQPDSVLSICKMYSSDVPDGKPEHPALYPAIISDDPSCVPKDLLYLTARIGLPLLFCLRDPPSFWQVGHEQLGKVLVDTQYNPILAFFGCRIRPGHLPKDGYPHHVRPKILLARADGKPLSVSLVLTLWAFMQELCCNAFEEHPDLSDRECSVKAYGNATPENFVEFWHKFHNDPHCPVKLGCKTCGKIEGVTLHRCGKCETVKYCDRDCQKSDWSVHKKVCKLYTK